MYLAGGLSIEKVLLVKILSIALLSVVVNKIFRI
jgi:hypothetical protein